MNEQKIKASPVIDLTNADAFCIVVDDDDDSSSVEVLSTVKSKNYPQEHERERCNDYAIAKALSENFENSTRRPNKRQRRGGKLFSCPICLNDSVESFQGYTLQACNHRYCKVCLQGLIHSNPPSQRPQIPCPHPDCNHTLSLGDIRYVLNSTKWNEYSQAASIASIERQLSTPHSGLRRCPADTCNYIFVDDENDRHFDCPLCHGSFCLRCDANHGRVGPAHVGISCQERHQQLQKQADERRKFERWRVENSRADERFQELMNKERNRGITRACPRCNRLITKNGGCNHMRCTGCGLDYNWSQSR